MKPPNPRPKFRVEILPDVTVPFFRFIEVFMDDSRIICKSDCIRMSEKRARILKRKLEQPWQQKRQAAGNTGKRKSRARIAGAKASKSHATRRRAK
jgi:hypothetical protein